MTDVRAPETDPFDPAAEADEQPRPASPGGGTFGLAAWLRWAWRQLTSMRIALVLLFLLALGSVPGSMLPQQGNNPAGVLQYFTSHPALAPWLNRLGLFNVFGAPWFAAIYLLLFASLVGCVVPRTFRLAGSARALPPRAPRHLARLPRSAEFATVLPPANSVEVSARVLAGHGFRLRRPGELRGPGDKADGDYWVSAEKGYLREAGNLLFHLALLGVLVSVALGGLFGYKADRLLIQGQSFADTASALDEFHPGRFVTAADLGPFTMTLNKFDASYITSGEQRGQPSAFDAQISYIEQPGGPSRTGRLEVNSPLSIDGAKVYLIGHGYAPQFLVKDGRGRVVYNAATPFVSGTSGNFLSEGVVKVPDAEPQQLGFTGVFVPTAVDVGGTLESVFPAADNPVVSLIAYAGNLGMNSAVPQSVYQLDTSGMQRLTASPQVLLRGQSMKLPGGQGTITFTGYVPWVSLAITHDPGQLPALICGMAALGGLLLSFMIRRRRVFVRARSADSEHGTTVQVGGLARTDASGSFEAEFATLAAELRSAHEQASLAPHIPSLPHILNNRESEGPMPVNVALGHVSNACLIAALVIYSLSVVAFAGDFAFGRPRRAAAARGQQAQDRAAALAAVGAAGAAAAGAVAACGCGRPGPAAAGAAADGPAGGADSMPELAVPVLRAIGAAGRWVQAALALSLVGVLAHTAAVITRGLAVHRAPWGNMYEFVTALTCVAALFFLFVMIRYRAWTLGVFVMGAVVVTLGLAETLIYTAARGARPGPAVVLAGYPRHRDDPGDRHLLRRRGARLRVPVGGPVHQADSGRQAVPDNAIIRRLPSIEQIDRLTYRTVVFGFPVWTFGVIAGAIWADQAWGRYWGWDPVETWAFITWVLYAAFLHARATAGWRGRRAHFIQLLGFTSLIFNILVVQVFIAGLHSYAGVS